MGREIHRVPLDFKWPLKKTWGGFLNPYSKQAANCTKCEGTGASPDVQRMDAEWYGTAPFDPLAYGAKVLWPSHPAILTIALRNIDATPEYYGTDAGAIDREVGRLWLLFKGRWCHNLIQADVDALVAEGRLMDFTHRPRTDE